MGADDDEPELTSSKFAAGDEPALDDVAVGYAAVWLKIFDIMFPKILIAYSLKVGRKTTGASEVPASCGPSDAHLTLNVDAKLPGGEHARGEVVVS